VRIFLGPTEIAGFYAALQRGLEEEGIDTIFADFSGNPLNYENRERSLSVRAVRAIETASRDVRPERRFRRALSRRLSSPARHLLFFWLAVRCDVFVYSYGGSITYRPEWEYRFLRRIGRRLIFNFHGNDSRAPYLGHPGLLGPNATNFAECARLTAEIKTNLVLVRQYAHIIVDTPFTAQLQFGRCVNAQILGNPCPQPPEYVAAPRTIDAPIRILHSPSDPALKGSDVIRAAIAEVKSRGRNVEFIELTGRPNAEVVQELTRCDFVVDQAYSDVPMAVFATEAAAYGKPAVVGGYITRSQMAASVAPEWLPPTLYCHPNEMVEVIDRLCVDEQFRVEQGEKAGAFVREVRNRRELARRLLRIVRDDIPTDWWFDAQDVEYVQGLGEENHVRRLIRGVVEHGGVRALQLDDNPGVRVLMLAFAGIDITPIDSGQRPSPNSTGVATPASANQINVTHSAPAG